MNSVKKFTLALCVALVGLGVGGAHRVGDPLTDGRDLDVTDLELSAGVGFRFTFHGASAMRIEFAARREGFRWIWVMSDIFRLRWQL